MYWQVRRARLARLILGQRSLRDQEGVVVGTTFTVDMNALFERFVEAIVDEGARRADLRLVPSARRRQLTKQIPIRPDLILQGVGRDLAVADVKFKERKPAEWARAKPYQLLAYCVSLNVPSGVLIYASDRARRAHI